MSNINDYKNIGIPEGYTKIKMYDEKTKKTKTYLVPLKEEISINNKIFDFTNNEFPFFNTLNPKIVTV